MLLQLSSLFLPLPTSSQLHPIPSLSQFSYHCLLPWVMHKCSLANPFTISLIVTMSNYDTEQDVNLHLIPDISIVKIYYSFAAMRFQVTKTFLRIPFPSQTESLLLSHFVCLSSLPLSISLYFSSSLYKPIFFCFFSVKKNLSVPWKLYFLHLKTICIFYKTINHFTST